MAADSLVLSASYFKYSDERQLIDDDDGWLEDDEEDDSEKDNDNVNISVKHVHFVTDASLSSWKNQDAAGSLSDTNYGNAKQEVKRFVEHVAVRITSLLLVLIDVIVLIVDLATPNKSREAAEAVQIITTVIVSLFLLEISLRIFASGKLFFKKWLEIFDLVVILISFIVTIVYLSMTFRDNYAKLIVIGRLIRVLLFFRVVSDKEKFERASRRMVSQNKRRYRKDGFDLDLTYVTVHGGGGSSEANHVSWSCYANIDDLHIQTSSKISKKHDQLLRLALPLGGACLFVFNNYKPNKESINLQESIIAMSFPSSGKYKIYRNPILEVVRFFDTKHPGHFKIYNLCSEKGYDHSLFHDKVYRLMIDDHNVPKLRELVDFCYDVKEWLSADPENIIAVHCKGGKGRTGTAVCSWLLACGKFRVAKESLEYFGHRRTDLRVGKTFQGVETPSQSRFVGYIENIIYDWNWKIPEDISMKIGEIQIEGINSVGNGDGSDLRFEIIVDGKVTLEITLKDQTASKLFEHNEVLDKLTINLDKEESPVIAGETKIKFYSSHKNVPKGYDKCAFFFWFHTGFIKENSLILSRKELDNPHKKKLWKTFKENFAVALTFCRVEDQPRTQALHSA